MCDGGSDSEFLGELQTFILLSLCHYNVPIKTCVVARSANCKDGNTHVISGRSRVSFSSRKRDACHDRTRHKLSITAIVSPLRRQVERHVSLGVTVKIYCAGLGSSQPGALLRNMNLPSFEHQQRMQVCLIEILQPF
jgi:hypothetical protein